MTSGDYPEEDQILFFDNTKVLDPKAWLRHGDAYHQVYDYMDERLTPDCIRNYKLNSVRIALPHIAAISAELYMKGILIIIGLGLKDIMRVEHDLNLLKDKCYELSKDDRLNDRELKQFLSDGPILTKNGGIKYPRCSVFYSGSHYSGSLDILKKILEEKINQKIMSK